MDEAARSAGRNKSITVGEKVDQSKRFEAIISQKRQPTEKGQFTFETKNMKPAWRGAFSVVVTVANAFALYKMMNDVDVKPAVLNQHLDECKVKDESGNVDEQETIKKILPVGSIVVFVFDGWHGYFNSPAQRLNRGQFQLYAAGNHKFMCYGDVRRIPVAPFPTLFSSIDGDLKKLKEAIERDGGVVRGAPLTRRDTGDSRKKSKADREKETARQALGEYLLDEAGLKNADGATVNGVKRQLECLGALGLLDPQLYMGGGIGPNANLSFEQVQGVVAPLVATLRFNYGMWGLPEGVLEASVGEYAKNRWEGHPVATAELVHLLVKKQTPLKPITDGELGNVMDVVHDESAC